MATGSNPYLKKANLQLEYTPEMVLELDKCAQSAEYFIHNYCEIQSATAGSIPFHLRDYQRKIIKTFAENRLSIALAPRQIGKALPLGTYIPTPSGWTTMGDVNVGDYVLGDNGKPTRVTAATEIMHNHQCYKLVLSSGETIKADAEHQWTVCDNKFNHSNKQYTKVLTTRELNTLNHTTGRYEIQLAAPVILPLIKLPVEPYQYGMWLSDELYKTETDLTVIRCKKIGYKCIQYNVSGTPISKLIPNEYLRSSIDQRLSLLTGLMDRNAYLSRTGQASIIIESEQLADNVIELISSLGYKSTLNADTTTGLMRYTIAFDITQIKYIPFSEGIKYTQCKNMIEANKYASDTGRSIVSVILSSSVPVRCISVDNVSKLYLITKSFIPTHNSWIAGAFLLWFAVFHDEKTVLILSNKNDNAMEMIHRVRFIYERLPHWVKPGLTADGWNKHSVAFDNGSRIISQATSENSGRGLAISLLFLDEFAFVRDTIAEEFWTSVSPTLATGGGCVICSTPNGDVNRFAQLWRGSNIPSGDNPNVGFNGFAPIEIKWNEPPGRGEKFKSEEIAKIGETRWRQEYCCFKGEELVEIQDLSGKTSMVTILQLYGLMSKSK